ncbi:hypothetical protein LTR17_002994 [Elasticomyces elasticus]|nr:hypothetical protein LTR17_002994 [Elasticomyces elasticus]
MNVPPEVWARFEQKGLLSKYAVVPPQGIDLDNEVHTLFARRRFSKDVDYEALLPALRLATKLFRSEASMIFCHTIFHAKVTLRNYPAGSGWEKHVYEVVHPPEALTKRQLKQVKGDLIALANVITYEHNLTNPRIIAMTRPADGDADHSGVRKPKGFFGLRSTIVFGGQLYADIVSNFRAKNRPDVTEELVYDHIMLANAICHELAHAAGNFRWGRQGNWELTIGDNAMAESGFDWETAIWGGILNLGGHGRYQLVTDWPSSAAAITCLRTGSRVSICGELESAQRSWVPPPGWLLQICHKSYWDEVVTHKGRAALQVPKLVGHRAKPVPCECSTCLPSLKWDGKDLTRRDDLWIKLRSPSCRIGDTYIWKPDLDETNPLDCVPKGYALLMTGWMVPERLMHKFQEPRIMGHGLIDPAPSDQPLEREVECEGCRIGGVTLVLAIHEPQSIRGYANSAYGWPEIGQSSDTKPYPITSKKRRDVECGVFVYNEALSICHYSN